MNLEGPLFRLGQAIGARVDRPDTSDPLTPSEVAEHISAACALPAAKAHALAWAEDIILDSGELDALAEEFNLHREVLGCLLGATSAEMLTESLLRAGHECLEPDRCEECAALASAIAHAAKTRLLTDLHSCAVDLLAHLNMPPLVAVDDEGVEGLSARLADLPTIFNELPLSGQLRVIACAHQELDLARANNGAESPEVETRGFA
jgi:hypothetical protein